MPCNVCNAHVQNNNKTKTEMGSRYICIHAKFGRIYELGNQFWYWSRLSSQ